MTPSELKYQVEKHGHAPHYFTRKTMQFFGDTMKNYGVRDGGQVPYYWDDTGNNYNEEPRMIEVWVLYRKRPVKHGLDKSAYFDKETFRQIR